MSHRTVFVPYRPKTILNKSKRPDHWFWTRYSAYPYIGCQHGCEFCYCREKKYSPFEDPIDFAYIIKVKENAQDLLRRILIHTPIDAIFTGDYQPAERKFMLSRRMLEVCYELGFPVFILERSPLVLRDLDLIQAIHQRAFAVVAFSVISTPESLNYDRVTALEKLAPTAEKRFTVMQELAKAGIPTGTCFMPILPGLCDDEANLEAVVRWTAYHGGGFVLASGLTLANQQRDYFFEVIKERFIDLLNLYQGAYLLGSYAPTGEWNRKIGLIIREHCLRNNIPDRQPRRVIPGDKHTLNKRMVELLANTAYSLELENAPLHRVWSFRKAAWSIEDLEQDLRLIYRAMGLAGLQRIPDIGPSMAKILEKLIKENESS